MTLSTISNFLSTLFDDIINVANIRMAEAEKDIDTLLSYTLEVDKFVNECKTTLLDLKQTGESSL